MYSSSIQYSFEAIFFQWHNCDSVIAHLLCESLELEISSLISKSLHSELYQENVRVFQKGRRDNSVREKVRIQQRPRDDIWIGTFGMAALSILRFSSVSFTIFIQLLIVRQGCLPIEQISLSRHRKPIQKLNCYWFSCRHGRISPTDEQCFGCWPPFFPPTCLSWISNKACFIWILLTLKVLSSWVLLLNSPVNLILCGFLFRFTDWCWRMFHEQKPTKMLSWLTKDSLKAKSLWILGPEPVS